MFRSKSGGRYGKRHIPGVMNKTEEQYAETLQARKLSGEVLAWWFEEHTFKLAPDTRFTPDFAVLLADGTMELVDVKGAPTADDALVKIKCAAEKFWQFKFVQEKKRAKRDGGGFERREF
jgi:hypothetical protein